MGLLDNLSGRLENLRADNRLHQSGDINAAQVALRTAGETIGGIGDIAMAPIAPLVPEFVKEGFSDLMGGVLSTGPAKTAMAWAKKNPEQARDVMSALNASALLPGGAMLSAGKKAVTYGPQATKGAGLSNISNYINNWYGPGKDFAGTPAEAAAKKAAGFTETAGKGLLGIIGHAVSPKSKALYGEQGITVPAQKIVQGHLDNIPTDTRALSKGVGQVQYGKHINAQSGRQGGTNAAADEIANRSFLQQHTPNTPGSIQQALNQHGVGMDDLIDTRKKKLESGAKEWRSLPNVPANPNDSRFVEKYLNDVMKFDQFVVKSPSSVQTGGHYSDIMHKNPAGAEIKAAFNLKKAPRNPDGTVDINAVAQRLMSRQGEANKKLPKGSAWRVVTKDPEAIAQNGLWLRGSKVGSSITEGGVGWLMKVEPDGTLTGYMFDKHDFLEKVPGVNIAAQKLLPNDVIAVTPAMKTQIKVPGIKGKHFKQTPQNTGTQDTMEALLQQYATAVPSKQNLRGEQMQMGGRALQMGGLLGASENR